MPRSNPFNPGDPVDVVNWQIFEDVAASYPMTFEQLCQRMLNGEPTDSLVEFVAAKVGEMVQAGVLLEYGDVLSIPANRPRRPKAKRQPRTKKEADPRQAVLF